ncbi:MAG: heat-inducible transcriptional repressor HrcA [Gammaproteobacteria bacterium]|nr:heat-inducible transcriptional repressor HrcA [Gammaproteobacteria bacterium]MDH3767331.1 heat-inducible transcriptional repressor HrcA [Gammaproteobacteria bacterium]
MTDAVPNERALQLLKTLVQRYIREGHPVGSRTLARESALDVSPATIRNIMADLEECGLVSSPHTSAGRVPTAAGLRVFVDTLVAVKPLQRKIADEIESGFAEPVVSSQELVTTASKLLSQVTHLAGVVTVPRRKHGQLRQIEFLQLSNNRVLAIIVVNEREVQNRILKLDRNYSESELRQAANYLTEQFAGNDVSDVRTSLLEELKQARQSMNEMMLNAIAMAQRAFAQGDNEEDFVLAGKTNLMDFAELSDVDKLRQLFDVFNRKRDILHLLDQCSRADGVQIFIGKESGYEALDECSVVSAPYTVDDEVVGVLGVIGPTRMAYERVIPIVDVTARLLGQALKMP